VDVSSSPERLRQDGGFTLVEVLVSTLVLTIGMIAIAGLLAVTTTLQIGSRESARSTRLAQTKLDELAQMSFAAPAVSIGGSLDENVDDYNESPDVGTTVRWMVSAGPTDGTRVVQVRVVNLRGQHSRLTELYSIIRE
jgi:Tfp pilus assembly protein PilV